MKHLQKPDLERIVKMKNQGKTNEMIAATLNGEGYSTVSGLALSGVSISQFMLTQGYRMRKHTKRSVLPPPAAQQRPTFLEDLSSILKTGLSPELKLISIEGLVIKEMELLTRP